MDYNGEQIRFLPELSDCALAMGEILDDPKPEFIARVGGSDTDIVIEYLDAVATSGVEDAIKKIIPNFNIVKAYNGYYDKSENPSNIVKYIEEMASCYRAISEVMFVGPALLTEFFPNNINVQFHRDISTRRQSIYRFLATIVAQKKSVRFYPYNFVEKITDGDHTLFKLFREKLPNRRVLAVTPFSESIRLNWERRNQFYKNFSYPDFSLTTYNAPITYAGLPDDFYPDADWFATLERMKSGISALDFDIALLSCGSYAIPLGVFIRDVLKKKAIYVGGALQLFFGITGRRYDNPFFLDQINADAFILPVERERYLQHVKIGDQTAKEAFGAYF